MRTIQIRSQDELAMLTNPQSIVAAIEIIESPEDVVYVNACALLESIGFEGPMYSAGPFERLYRIYKEEILPRIEATKGQFDASVNAATIAVTVQLQEAIAAVNREAVVLKASVADYLLRMEQEGLAGPKTARLVILFATADALKKLIDADGQFSTQTLSISELFMMALAVMRMKMDVVTKDGV